MWNGLTEASRRAGAAPFIEIEAMMEEAEKQRIVKDLPRPFAQMTMNALAETMMELVRQDPDRTSTYCTAGFEMFWAGMTRR
jgi:hypothetical protein